MDPCLLCYDVYLEMRFHCDGFFNASRADAWRCDLVRTKRVSCMICCGPRFVARKAELLHYACVDFCRSVAQSSLCWDAVGFLEVEAVSRLGTVWNKTDVFSGRRSPSIPK